MEAGDLSMKRQVFWRIKFASAISKLRVLAVLGLSSWELEVVSDRVGGIKKVVRL